MNRLKRTFAHIRMAAFVNKQLSPRARSTVAHEIDRNDATYTDYLRERETARDLGGQLPGFGAPDTATLGRVWSAVQRDLHASRRARMRPYALRYGVVIALVVIVLVLPTALRPVEVRAELPEHPKPQWVQAESVTPRSEAAPYQPTAIAQLALTDPGADCCLQRLDNTPLRSGTPAPTGR